MFLLEKLVKIFSFVLDISLCSVAVEIFFFFGGGFTLRYIGNEMGWIVGVCTLHL